jgi:HNH endonuclease
MSAVAIQKTFPSESDRHFLLKLDANDCLSGKPQPQAPSDWEGTYFHSTKPRATRHGEPLPPDQREAPVPGDNLLIWINMQTGGSGLTATARVSSCEHRDTELRIRVESVVLFPEPRIDNAMLRPRDKSRRPDDILEDIKFTRTSKLRYLSPSDWEELNAKAGSKSDKLFQQGAEEEVSRRERLGTISSRPAQVDFSVRLRRAYNGKCAVTGCTTPEALEAAHIRVNEREQVGDGTTFRNDDNNLENGILLRADIHALFDRGLATLSQDGTKIQVSALLTDKTYAFLEIERVFRPAHSPPSRQNITSHRRRFGFPCD